MRHLLALSALPCLAACATAGGKYPSLAVRDVERVQGQFESVPAPPLDVPKVAAPLTGPLAGRIAALGVQATSAHQSFLASAPRAERAAAAAAGDAVGSTAWAAAQVALSELDSARSQTAIALAYLDTLMVAYAVQAEDVSSIETVRQQVIAQVTEEDETLARLRGRVR